MAEANENLEINISEIIPNIIKDENKENSFNELVQDPLNNSTIHNQKEEALNESREIQLTQDFITQNNQTVLSIKLQKENSNCKAERSIEMENLSQHFELDHSMGFELPNIIDTKMDEETELINENSITDSKILHSNEEMKQQQQDTNIKELIDDYPQNQKRKNCKRNLNL